MNAGPEGFSASRDSRRWPGIGCGSLGRTGRREPWRRCWNGATSWCVRPVANLDYLVLVASIADPSPSTLILDKMIAIAEKKGIEPLVVINKADLEDTSWLEDIYGTTGLPCFTVSASGGEGVEPLRQRLLGHISAFTGNSGVGKSSLLNAIDPRLTLETGEISKKLGRGRHTTRTATLFRLEGGGYIVDTPGFSSLDMERAERISKEDLPNCFREFAPYRGGCRFTSCAHVKEPAAPCGRRWKKAKSRLPGMKATGRCMKRSRIKRIGSSKGTPNRQTVGPPMRPWGSKRRYGSQEREST